MIGGILENPMYIKYTIWRGKLSATFCGALFSIDGCINHLNINGHSLQLKTDAKLGEVSKNNLE